MQNKAWLNSSNLTNLEMSLASLSGTEKLISRPWVIQKFGGTSVGKFPEKIANEIVKVYSKTYNVAVVCSARSTGLKVEGTTSRLLKCAEMAQNDEDFLTVIELIRNDHLETATRKIHDVEILSQLKHDINHECDYVIKLLHAAQIIEEVSARTLDIIISVGEKLSCLYVTALLNDNNVPAEYVDLSNVIPVTCEPKSENGGSGSLNADFYKDLVKRLREVVLSAYNNGTKVPVITGYFGNVPGGLLNGVGRGYTDLCAALTAVATNSEELQIWKEVDGIFTADPRKVPEARLLPAVTPDEAAELTYYGSEVIHPFTMEQVINARIPIRIKNVQNPEGNGTIVYPDNLGIKDGATPPHPPHVLEKISSSYFLTLQKRKITTAVTTKSNIVVINVHSNKRSLSHGFLAGIFATLNKHKLVVDLISTSEVHVSMAIHRDGVPEHNLKEAIEELRKIGTIDVTRNLSIISLIGKQMRSLIGIAGQMFATLAQHQINIEMISQGANEINISCVINQKDALKALQVIHANLLKIPDLNGNDNVNVNGTSVPSSSVAGPINYLKLSHS